MSNKNALQITSAVSLVSWMVWTIWSAWLTGPVISDSWQSIGPAVAARHPFDLSGLFLGDFDGYDKSWGHHWPGWAMLTSFVFSWLSFHSVIVFSIEALLVIFTGALVFRMTKERAGLRWAALGATLVLLDPAIHVSISMMRPESLTGCLLLVLTYAIDQGSAKWRWLVGIFCLSSCLPMIHVMGCVTPPAILVAGMLQHRCSFRAFWSDPARKLYILLAAGWAFGCIGLACWFVSDANRLHQFTQNLAAQRLSSHGLWNSLRSCYLGDPNGILMLIIFGVIALAAVIHIYRSKQCGKILLYCSMPLAAVVFSVLAENPNRIHLASVVPCAVVALIAAISSRVDTWNFSSRIFSSVLIGAVCLALVFHSKRMFLFWQTQGVSSRAATEQWLGNYRGDYKIYLPLSLWEAAAVKSKMPYLFYTFPNVAQLDYRLAAEASLWSKAEIDDLLIYDLTQSQAVNDYFHPDAFVKLRSVDPYALGDIVETRRIKGLYGDRVYQVIKVTHLPSSPLEQQK